MSVHHHHVGQRGCLHVLALGHLDGVAESLGMAVQRRRAVAVQHGACQILHAFGVATHHCHVSARFLVQTGPLQHLTHGAVDEGERRAHLAAQLLHLPHLTTVCFQRASLLLTLASPSLHQAVQAHAAPCQDQGQEGIAPLGPGRGPPRRQHAHGERAGCRHHGAVPVAHSQTVGAWSQSDQRQQRSAHGAVPQGVGAAQAVFKAVARGIQIVDGREAQRQVSLIVGYADGAGVSVRRGT